MIGQSAATIARARGLEAARARNARALIVEESGIGREHPFSGEKLSPVLTVYRARDFDDALQRQRIYAFIRAPATRSACTRRATERALMLGLACRSRA